MLKQMVCIIDPSTRDKKKKKKKETHLQKQKQQYFQFIYMSTQVQNTALNTLEQQKHVNN